MAAPSTGHNGGEGRLRSFFARVESLDEQAKALNEDRALVFKEAADEGWNVKAMKTVLAERRMIAKNPAAYATLMSEVEMYRAQLGMADALRAGAGEAA